MLNRDSTQNLSALKISNEQHSQQKLNEKFGTVLLIEQYA